MAKKMKDAPIYFALGQVRFNPITKIDSYVPAIQDRFRLAGYPDFERAVQPGIVFEVAPTLGAPPPMPSIQLQTRFQFLNTERTAGYVVDQGALTFQTTEYDTHEVFFRDLLNGIEVIHEAVNLSFSSRVGIRMLNAVVPKSGDDLGSYLAPSVLGLLHHLQGRDLVHVFSETRTAEGKSVLVSRAAIYQQAEEGVRFPDDLTPVFLQVAEKFTKVKGLYGVIDADSWYENRERFDLRDLKDRLESLYTALRRSFEAIASPHAFKVWDQL